MCDELNEMQLTSEEFFLNCAGKKAQLVIHDVTLPWSKMRFYFRNRFVDNKKFESLLIESQIH